MSDLHCEACRKLPGGLRGSWHRYAQDFARRGNRRGCHANAGFDNVDWGASISHQLARDDNLRLSIEHHSDRLNGKADDDEAAHRRRTRARSRAQVTDYVWVGNPHAEGIAKLWKIMTEGVEDRESLGGQEWSPVPGVTVVCKAGRRPATVAELGRAVLHAGWPTLTSDNDLTEEQLLGKDTFTMDRQGNIKVTTTARWASEQRNKIEGLNKEKIQVDVEVRGGLEFVAVNLKAETLALQNLLDALRLALAPQGGQIVEIVGADAAQAFADLSEALPEINRRVLIGPGEGAS